MSLKKCKECGFTVSSEARNCPHCGIKLNRSVWLRCLTSILVIMVCSILIIIASLLILYFIDTHITEHEQIKEYVKQHIEERATKVVFRNIVDIKKSSNSSGDYLVYVLVSVPNRDDQILVFNVSKAGGYYNIGMDMRSALFYGLLNEQEE